MSVKYLLRCPRTGKQGDKSPVVVTQTGGNVPMGESEIINYNNLSSNFGLQRVDLALYGRACTLFPREEAPAR